MCRISFVKLATCRVLQFVVIMVRLAKGSAIATKVDTQKHG